MNYAIANRKDVLDYMQSCGVEWVHSSFDRNWHSHGAVSYTHLDVYKRQAPTSPACKPTGSMTPARKAWSIWRSAHGPHRCAPVQRPCFSRCSQKTERPHRCAPVRTHQSHFRCRGAHRPQLRPPQSGRCVRNCPHSTPPSWPCMALNHLTHICLLYTSRCV